MESRSLKCRLTTPPDQPRHPKSRIAPSEIGQAVLCSVLGSDVALVADVADLERVKGAGYSSQRLPAAWLGNFDKGKP